MDPGEDSTVFYVLRHAETVWSREDRIQGQRDTGLTALGEEQAMKAGEACDLDFDLYHSSDLERPKETARLFQEGMDLDADIELSEDLRERDFGVMQGEPSSAIDTGSIESLDPEEGESWDEIYERAAGYIEEVADSAPGQQVAVFTHKGVIQALLAELAPDMTGGEAYREDIGYLSGVVLEAQSEPRVYDEGDYCVDMLEDV